MLGGEVTKEKKTKTAKAGYKFLGKQGEGKEKDCQWGEGGGSDEVKGIRGE